jgi:hypothetical protein
MTLQHVLVAMEGMAEEEVVEVAVMVAPLNEQRQAVAVAVVILVVQAAKTISRT